MSPTTRSALLRGGVLFDRGLFFEAHEVWEEAWLRESGTTRRLLQGLIQIAAALHKVSRKEHPGGAVRLFDAGLAKLDAGLARLDGIPAIAAGVDLPAFIEAVRECREAAHRWAAGGSEPPEPSAFPKLAVPPDAET